MQSTQQAWATVDVGYPRGSSSCSPPCGPFSLGPHTGRGFLLSSPRAELAGPRRWEGPVLLPGPGVTDQVGSTTGWRLLGRAAPEAAEVRPVLAFGLSVLSCEMAEWRPWSPEHLWLPVSSKTRPCHQVPCDHISPRESAFPLAIYSYGLEQDLPTQSPGPRPRQTVQCFPPQGPGQNEGISITCPTPPAGSTHSK